ncbi:MAG: glycosyltransferase [Deltaproteobacteria bacterium]|nr:glycosyltransferase [Deltaproteobacteria bacterium]
MNIVYSFNKKGYEADFWQREIAAASNEEFRFIPFNHDPYLPDYRLYLRAQLLDNLYFDRHPGLMHLYEDFSAFIKDQQADAIIVDNCPPYHPEYLRRLPVYKVLRIADGPISAYDRDFAYLHAYQQVLYHSPAYSLDLGMADKLRYCGMHNADWWPLGFFDIYSDHTKTVETILAGQRDIDIIFVGNFHRSKMSLLAKVKKAFGRRLRLHGPYSLKKNLYFNLKYGFPGWVRPIPYEQFVPLYQRTKIGFNVHNRGDCTVGSYRLFELPANGVMQISDGGEYLNQFFREGEEIVGYKNSDDLIDKIRYYLDHDEERQAIALRGYQRVLRDYRIGKILVQAGRLIQQGMARIDWRK